MLKMKETKVKKKKCIHDFKLNNGGRCINWSGAIGTYVCGKCKDKHEIGYQSPCECHDAIYGGKE